MSMQAVNDLPKFSRLYETKRNDLVSVARPLERATAALRFLAMISAIAM